MNLLTNFLANFRSMTPLELASRELAEAEVALLHAQTGREYATAICSYNEARIRRLKDFLDRQK